jgi:hypothetical protein
MLLITFKGAASMGRLFDLVSREYEEEVRIISEVGGSLWLKRLALAIALIIACGIGMLFGDPWSMKEIACGILFAIAFPFVQRLWQRYKVAAEMRHHREIRMETKLDALLGIVKIEEDEES